MVMRPVQTIPYMLDNTAGQLLEALGAIVVIKANSEQTGGAFNLLEITIPPGRGTPLLIHYTEDVAIYVLEGTLAIFWGSEKKIGTAGCFFYQPRGTPHGFRVEVEMPARILYLTVPAGFDGFVIEHQLQTADAEREMAAARHKIEILGSLPDSFDSQQKNSKRSE